MAEIEVLYENTLEERQQHEHRKREGVYHFDCPDCHRIEQGQRDLINSKRSALTPVEFKQWLRWG